MVGKSVTSALLKFYYSFTFIASALAIQTEEKCFSLLELGRNEMKLKALLLCTVVFVAGSLPVKAEDAVNTADEFIRQAHGHDNMYTLGAEASQEKALSFYESALAAGADEKQRLHILYRMAQLWGSSYDLTKGEKPNFHKAIELNKRIIDSYQPEEPLVYKAMSSICDHYTTLRKFEGAVEWAKKTLEYDTKKIAEQIEATDRKREKRILKKLLRKIQGYQKVAVDQVAYSADLIDPLRAHGELRAITEKYYGSFIAERAGVRLAENMAKMPSLWAPQNDEPLSPSGSSLQAGVSAPAVHNEAQKNIQIQSEAVTEVTEKRCLVEPNTAVKPQKDKHVAREPRAPPKSYFVIFIIVAAGLIVLVPVVYFRKKKITPYI